MLDWRLTPLMRQIVEACERLGGGGKTGDVEREASLSGDTGPYGGHAHFAQGFRQLEERGILRSEWQGSDKLWFLTADAWVERGHRGPAPRTQQLGLL